MPRGSCTDPTPVPRTMAFLVSALMKCARVLCGGMKGVAVVGVALAAGGFGWVVWRVWTAAGPVPALGLIALAAAVAFKLTRPKKLPVLHATPQRPGTLRVVLVSDTHCKHGDLTVPPGDVLLHAGDFTRRGTVAVRASAGMPPWCTCLAKLLTSVPRSHLRWRAGDQEFQRVAWHAATPAQDCGRWEPRPAVRPHLLQRQLEGLGVHEGGLRPGHCARVADERDCVPGA